MSCPAREPWAGVAAAPSSPSSPSAAPSAPAKRRGFPGNFVHSGEWFAERRRPKEAVKAFDARLRRAEIGELTFEDFEELEELRTRAEQEL